MLRILSRSGLFEGGAHRKSGFFGFLGRRTFHGKIFSMAIFEDRGIYEEGPLPKSKILLPGRALSQKYLSSRKTTNLDELLSPNSPSPQISSFPNNLLQETVLGWVCLLRALSRSGLFEGRSSLGRLFGE